MRRYITVETEIDISDYIDEIPTEMLLKEINSRSKINEVNNNIKYGLLISINDFKTNHEKRQYLCTCLSLNNFDKNNKQRFIDIINELFI